MGRLYKRVNDRAPVSRISETEMSKLATAMLAKESGNLSDLRCRSGLLKIVFGTSPSFKLNMYSNPRPWKLVGLRGLGGLESPMVGSNGVGTARARPTPQKPAGVYAPTVVSGGIGRSFVTEDLKI